jgi:hypothetical protein
VRQNFKTGKWLLPVNWSMADEVWAKLVRGLLAGKFPPEIGVRFIKVVVNNSKNVLSSDRKLSVSAEVLVSATFRFRSFISLNRF